MTVLPAIFAAPQVFAQCNATWNLAGGIPGFDNPVLDLLQTDGGLFACGRFSTVAGFPALNIARWDGTAWQNAGSIGSTASEVRQLLERNNGDLLACGSIGFPTNPSAHIARFNGTSWGPAFPGFTGGSVSAMTELPNGDLVVGGDFNSAGIAFAPNIAVWDGSAWSGLPTNVGNVKALATAPGGGFYAGGDFTTTLTGGAVANRIARWSGSSWSALGSGLNGSVRCIRVLDNGDVIVGGGFSTAGGLPANGVALYRPGGGGWMQLGAGLSGVVNDIEVLPSGDLVAGGNFTGVANPGITNIARFDQTTSTWVALAPTGSNGQVLALELTTEGEIAAATFATAAGFTTQYFARLVSGCPPVTTPYGTGCPGQGGFLTLTSDMLPWSGTTISMNASGFGPNSLGLSILSLTQANVLLSTAPEFAGIAGPTCLALATPELSTLVIPINGEVSWDIDLPIDPMFAGTDLFHQGIELEFGTNGIVFVGSTNGIQTTIGTF